MIHGLAEDRYRTMQARGWCSGLVFVVGLMACGPILTEGATTEDSAGASEPITTGSTGAGLSTTRPTTGAMTDGTSTGAEETTRGSSSGTNSGAPGTTEMSTSEGSTSEGSTSEASTSDASTSEASTSDGGWWLNKPAGLTGCPLTTPAGTDVQGKTELGAFAGTRAYFGFYSFGDDVEQASVRVWVLDEAADAALTLQEIETKFIAQTGPALFADFQGNLADTQWLGSEPLYGAVVEDQVKAFLEGELWFTAHAGSWDVADAADPPRIVGTLTGAVGGPFDAVYCDTLTSVLKEG